VAVAIDLTSEERGELEGLAARRRTAQGLARLARIVLLFAELTEKQIGRGVHHSTNALLDYIRSPTINPSHSDHSADQVLASIKRAASPP
jgi:hypothetical protein